MIGELLLHFKEYSYNTTCTRLRQQKMLVKVFITLKLYVDYLQQLKEVFIQVYRLTSCFDALKRIACISSLLNSEVTKELLFVLTK